MNQLDSPTGRNDVFFAWTADFLETYEKKYSSSLLNYLPELIWNLPEGKPSSARVRYRDFSVSLDFLVFTLWIVWKQSTYETLSHATWDNLWISDCTWCDSTDLSWQCERFVSAFMDQLADWCGKNNLYLNGHMMEEPTLRQQTCALGEAMRCYRSMQMPGMDLLCDWTEYNTAKQVRIFSDICSTMYPIDF